MRSNVPTLQKSSAHSLVPQNGKMRSSGNHIKFVAAASVPTYKAMRNEVKRPLSEKHHRGETLRATEVRDPQTIGEKPEVPTSLELEVCGVIS